MVPCWPYGEAPHPPRDERPYWLRTAEELGAEADWVRSLYCPEEMTVHGGDGSSGG